VFGTLVNVFSPPEIMAYLLLPLYSGSSLSDILHGHLFLGFAWTFLTLHAVSMILKKIPSPSVSWSRHYCSRNNKG